MEKETKRKKEKEIYCIICSYDVFYVSFLLSKINFVDKISVAVLDNIFSIKINIMNIS